MNRGGTDLLSIGRKAGTNVAKAAASRSAPCGCQESARRWGYAARVRQAGLGSAHAETRPAVIAIVGPLTPGKQVLQLAERMRNVEMPCTQMQAAACLLGYRMRQLIDIDQRLA